VKYPPYITHIVGIDEVGRGPLAGPVTLGACVVPVSLTRKSFKLIRDSKKLTAQSREVWYQKMLELKKDGTINFALASISPKQIDTKGLSWAIKTALSNAIEALNVNPEITMVLLDGGLKAPAVFKYQKTIIKGDEKEFSISLASIAAKVTRDVEMTKLAKKYPAYGFEVHKGYGTLKHREAIKKHGPSKIHRMSFLKNIL
jgi:ribonuclease HII